MPKSLTCEERLDLELATKGETLFYRRYPHRVVAAWLSAEIICSGSAPKSIGVAAARQPYPFLRLAFSALRRALYAGLRARRPHTCS